MIGKPGVEHMPPQAHQEYVQRMRGSQICDVKLHLYTYVSPIPAQALPVAKSFIACERSNICTAVGLQPVSVMLHAAYKSLSSVRLASHGQSSAADHLGVWSHPTLQSKWASNRPRHRGNVCAKARPSHRCHTLGQRADFSNTRRLHLSLRRRLPDCERRPVSAANKWW